MISPWVFPEFLLFSSTISMISNEKSISAGFLAKQCHFMNFFQSEFSKHKAVYVNNCSAMWQQFLRTMATTFVSKHKQNMNKSHSIMTKLWTTQGYSINILNKSLKIFRVSPECYDFLRKFPEFSRTFPDFPGLYLSAVNPVRITQNVTTHNNRNLGWSQITKRYSIAKFSFFADNIGLIGIMLPSKWENLNRCSTKLIRLQKTTACIGLQAEQIFSVNI